MIIYRMLVAILCVLLCLTKGAAEADRTISSPGLVLTNSALDSSRVAVGAWVEIVYGTGARYRLSGKWRKKVTIRGVIQAVDWEQRQLTLIRQPEEETEILALDRIRTLRVIDTDAIEDEALESFAERGNMSTNKRVALKLITGTIGGLIGAMIATSSIDCNRGDNEDPFCELGAALLYGYPIGTAVGVNTLGPRDRSRMSRVMSLGVCLGGSIVGFIGGIGLTKANDMLWPSVLVGPAVGATLASELWSKPSGAQYISIDLMPNPKRMLSAIATLRF